MFISFVNEFRFIFRVTVQKRSLAERILKKRNGRFLSYFLTIEKRGSADAGVLGRELATEGYGVWDGEEGADLVLLGGGLFENISRSFSVCFFNSC
jgi:hypothetical protein